MTIHPYEDDVVNDTHPMLDTAHVFGLDRLVHVRIRSTISTNILHGLIYTHSDKPEVTTSFIRTESRW